MINFSLICEQNHEFDAWFSSSADFDQQLASGFVNCPSCESSNISKTLMSPSVSTGRQREKTALVGQHSARQEMAKQLKSLREKMIEGAEDVGRGFAEEARKIHYGETEQRGIYGEANREEVIALVDEGVDIVPLPDAPEEAN